MSKARKIKKKDGKYTYEVNEVVGKMKMEILKGFMLMEQL